MKNNSNSSRSRDFPAISINKAIELARRIYDKDRWAEAPALSAAINIGYGTLNGGSLRKLSALKKFGLIEYIGSGDNKKVKLTDLAKRIILPQSQEEKGAAIAEAFGLPAIHQELLEKYPGWSLPSEATLAAILERELQFQHGAVMPFIKNLTEGIEFVGRNNTSDAGAREASGTTIAFGMEGSAGAVTESKTVVEPLNLYSTGLIRLPMPGSPSFIEFPNVLDSRSATRIIQWLDQVVKPAILFAGMRETEGGSE